MSRVTLKELAQHLGLAEGTVSRAMNNYSDISPKTREKVQKAADALGYRPNHTARRLATGRAEAVAYLMPTSSSAISNPFVSQLLEGLGDALSKRAWDLLVVQPQSAEDELDALRKLVASGKVSGVVLSRPTKVDARIDYLKKTGFPFIVHGRARDSAGYAWYDIDGRQAMMDAVDHLVALGHSKIAFIGAPTYQNFANDRLDGYRAGLAANGLVEDANYISIAELTDEGGERAAFDLLSEPEHPTALICVTDVQAIGALAAIRARGWVPGEDVSVIGYDGVWMGRHANPPLTSMAQPQAHSGRQLGDMLLSIIDGGNPEDFQVLRKAELIRRKSDGPPKLASQKTRQATSREVL